ncbi:MAG: hypothetical protein EBS87_09270 [Sphingomonadaceae bacterium]|nr:hypothetical protein [Sphingomonadaceae bacterium]NBU78988.1 hypothetical protein [Sphingomonadaceae bacterium]NCA02352.1 hypothetical protein [Sphingomonadaceae bacterium]
MTLLLFTAPILARTPSDPIPEGDALSSLRVQEQENCHNCDAHRLHSKAIIASRAATSEMELRFFFRVIRLNS